MVSVMQGIPFSTSCIFKQTHKTQHTQKTKAPNIIRIDFFGAIHTNQKLTKHSIGPYNRFTRRCSHKISPQPFPLTSSGTFSFIRMGNLNMRNLVFDCKAWSLASCKTKHGLSLCMM